MSQTGDSSLAAPIYAGDYQWDQSFVGNYGNPLLPATDPMGVNDLGLTAPLLNPDEVSKTMKWGNNGGAPMLSTPNCESPALRSHGLCTKLTDLVLIPWFPTAEERSLILHYCANAADLMMAIPSGLNPMLAINLPLALDSPRGESPSPFSHLAIRPQAKAQELTPSLAKTHPPTPSAWLF